MSAEREFYRNRCQGPFQGSSPLDVHITLWREMLPVPLERLAASANGEAGLGRAGNLLNTGTAIEASKAARDVLESLFPFL